MSDKLIKLIATFFYVGSVPYAPGTVASAVGVLIYLILQPVFPLYLLVLVGLVLLGLIISEPAEGVLKRRDPPEVVIDEVAGMLLACFLLPPQPSVLIGAFVLFRLFDITKIYPIKRLENLKGSLGIMADDLMAGIYTNIIMHIAVGLF
ncbi:MAG TPA: phosphatidylglycerophosphatase A [Candidatus Omnitrophota bacterium]|nr:phosphatidylglycerophosphatase A [Candidatus Omnitrophota bacterium]